jgi:hypothetical protein
MPEMPEIPEIPEIPKMPETSDRIPLTHRFLMLQQSYL